MRAWEDIRNHAVLALAGALGAYALSRAIGTGQASATAMSILFGVTLAVSFIRGTDALYIIIFSVIFSPEVGTALGSGRLTGEGAGGVIVRLEDVFLIAVGLGWLLRTAYQRRQFGIVRTPVNLAIGGYMAASIIATLLGVLDGTVRRLETGVFHNLKYFEYFFLFFMILAHVRQKRVIVRLIAALLVVFFLALVYGYTQLDPSGVRRLSAPFDVDEPNTFGGYIALMACVAGGIALTDPRVRVRAATIALVVLAVPPLLFTLSRASYMAFLAGSLAFIVFSRRRWIVLGLAVALTGLALLGAPLLPEKVRDRIAGTFRAETEYHVRVGGVDLDSSASARIVSYGWAVQSWLKSPLFGHGVTGTHFIDSQYFRLLAETGLLGLAAFLFMIGKLQREIWRAYRQIEDRFLQGVALGAFCGIWGMLAHALSANTFIIVRIAEPLWLLAGLILLVPRLAEEETAPHDTPPANPPPDTPQAASAPPAPPLRTS